MNMKQVLLCLYAVLFSSVVCAAPISGKKAAKIANDFMLSVKKQFPQGYAQDVTELDRVYVINYSIQKRPIGFVIVASDDSLPPILAFSMQGRINLKNKTIAALLEGYSHEIRAWQEGKVTDSATDTIYYQRKENFRSPLLKGITWAQNAPYNLQIPVDIDGKKSLVGCTSTAMGQIMKYYQYPSHGTGENTYMRTNKRGKTFSAAVNYDSLRIDWSNIRNSYTPKDSAEAYNSVSKLLYYCALSAEANFSSEVTGAGLRNATIAMFKHFNYHPSIQMITANLSDIELQQLLYRELEADRPVLCSGYRHAFVCDGFAGDYFHFNWGWGGRMNGYYKLSALKAGSGNNIKIFDGIVVNIRPENHQKTLHKTVKLAQPGTLRQHISDEEALTLTSLTITGKLNGKDLNLIRNMAGNTQSIWEQSGELRVLDLSKAEILTDTVNPYHYIDARKARLTKTVSGRKTADKKPRTFKFETITDDEWKLLCQLKGDVDGRNQSWRYVKRDGSYFLQYYTTANIITPYLFQSCTNLEKLLLPEKTQEIQQSAFQSCSSLQQMEIPARTEEIHPQAWVGCLSIKSVTAHPASPYFIDKDSILYSKDFTVLVYYPSYKTSFTYDMPKTIEYIRSYAFNEALFLRKVNLSPELRTIPKYSFFSCPSLQTVQLPENVTQIFDRVFYRCKTLSSITLPSTIEKLGTDVFYKCGNLTDIYCNSATPPEVKARTFYGLEENGDVKLWVPKGTVESYKQTPWKYFKNISEL